MRKQFALLLMLFSLVLAACGSDGSTGGQTPAAPAEASAGAAESSPAAEASAAQAATGGKTVKIWWNKGYYPEEDEALQQIVAEWEQQSGNKADLSFYTTEDLPKKTQSAVEAGNPPDVVFAHFSDWQLLPRYAWEGRLADVSDVVEPLKDQYTEGALTAVRFQNNAENKRSYYGVPLEQQTIHTFFWKDMLQEMGSSEEQIPTTWDDFWAFWTQCQKTMRDKGERVYAMGLPISSAASDTYFVFEQILEAYDVQLVDQDGNLHADDPKVKEGIVKALNLEAQPYKDKLVPPGAVTWQDPDNNLNFLNRTTCMTPNATLSIPASKRDDEDLYKNKIGTSEWPDEPDGEPITYMVAVKSAMVFKDAENVDAAKDFLRFLVQPDKLGQYVQGSLGRWFPVMPEILNDPFWSDPSDPHIPVAKQQFAERPTRPFPQVYNPAYSQVLAENVWGKALAQVALEDVPAEQAAQTALDRIKAIWESWK